jgi:hypothetical protein
MQASALTDYVVGIVFALAVCACASAAGFDKDRSFYATVLIAIASYYLLFAAIAGSASVLAIEFVPFVGFSVMAILGARRWPILVAIGLFAHGLFDLLHEHVVTNPGIPSWWPEFCLAFDVTAGAYLMVLNAKRQRAAARNAV